jgi:hypothetical protein
MTGARQLQDFTRRQHAASADTQRIRDQRPSRPLDLHRLGLGRGVSRLQRRPKPPSHSMATAVIGAAYHSSVISRGLETTTGVNSGRASVHCSLGSLGVAGVTGRQYGRLASSLTQPRSTDLGFQTRDARSDAPSASGADGLVRAGNS